LILNGEMLERSIRHAWKACVGETLPWVRIPLSPPTSLREVSRSCAGFRHDPTRFARRLGLESHSLRQPSPSARFALPFVAAKPQRRVAATICSATRRVRDLKAAATAVQTHRQHRRADGRSSPPSGSRRERVARSGRPGAAAIALLSRASEPLPMPQGTPDAINLATALIWRDHL
jgi:Mg-chelatase subunit ChlI